MNSSFSAKGRITEINEEKRTFGGWLTVEIKDAQNDILPIQRIKELGVLNVMKERNAPITMGHRDYPFAKFTGFEFRQKEVDGKDVDGVWFTAEAYNHHKTDDEAWNSLKEWKRQGKEINTSVSWSKEAADLECEGKQCANVWKDFGLLSLAVLPPSETPANAEASIEMVSGAKSIKGLSFKFSNLCPSGKAEPCGECPLTFLKTGEHSAEYITCGGSAGETKNQILIKGGGDVPKKEEIGDPEEKPKIKPDNPVEGKAGGSEQETPLAAIEAMLTKIYDALMSKQEPEDDPQTHEEEAEKVEDGDEDEDEDEDPGADEKVEGYQSADGTFHPIRESEGYSDSKPGSQSPRTRQRRRVQRRGSSSMETLVAKAVTAELDKLGIKKVITPGQTAKAGKGISKLPIEEGAKGVITGTELAKMDDKELLTKIEGGEFA
ncbi:MAG: hypothetical protein ACC644_02725 [Candidatus Hydrothermarchaeales archaeon]